MLESLHVAHVSDVAVADFDPANDRACRVTVPFATQRITVTPKAHRTVPCLVPESCLPWDAENQQPLVWGATSPEEARSLADAYAFAPQTQKHGRVCRCASCQCPSVLLFSRVHILLYRYSNP